MKEQNELLEAALKLAELVKALKAKGEIFFEALELIQTIEAHRPRPKRLEGWINVYEGFPTWCYIWLTEQGAKGNFAMTIVFAGYAFSNVGLYLATKA